MIRPDDAPLPLHGGLGVDPQSEWHQSENLIGRDERLNGNARG